VAANATRAELSRSCMLVSWIEIAVQEEARVKFDIRLNECRMLSGSWKNEGSDPAQMTDKRVYV